MGYDVLFVVVVSYIFIQRFFTDKKLNPIEILLGAGCVVLIFDQLTTEKDFIMSGAAMASIYLVRAALLVYLGLAEKQSVIYYVMVSLIFFFVSYVYLFTIS